MTSLVRLLLPLAAAAALAACKVESINYFPPTPAPVRFVNLMADAPVLDVREGETTVWPAVGPEGSTAYQDFENTRKTFTLAVAGQAEPLLDISQSLAGKQPYTLVAYGTVGDPRATLLPEQTVFLDNGTFQFRLLNAAVGSGLVDLFLTTPDTDFSTALPTIVGINYGVTSVFLSATAGDYIVRITENGTRNVLYEAPARAFAEKVGVNIIVFSRGGGRLVNVALVDTAEGSTGVIPESTLARYKVVNGASSVASVDQLVDGTRVVTGLAYPTASAYNTATPGSRTFAFEATSAPGATIASVVHALRASTDSTVFLTGSAGPVQAVAVSDTNLPPAEGNARLRFVNASLEAGALDVFVDGTRQASALAAKAASGYVEVAAGTLAVSFNDAVSGATLLALPSVTVAGGSVTTIFAVGPPSQLSSVVTQDR